MFLEINIGNFGSYFALFAGLNLGYASSQSFRDAIDSGILKIGEKTINDRILKLQSRYKALIQTARQNHKEFGNLKVINEAKVRDLATNEEKLFINSTDGSDQNKEKSDDKISSHVALRKSPGHLQAEKNLAQINTLNSKFQKTISELDLERKNAANFVESFKSMFLITAFYCMTFLVLAGLQNSQYNCYYYNIINFLTIFIIPFNMYVFSRSKGENFDKKIKPVIVVAMFFSIVLLTIFFNLFTISIRTGSYLPLELCLPFACLVAISPYIIHFIKAANHRAIFKPKEEKLISDNEKAVEEWDKVFEKDKNQLETEKHVLDFLTVLSNKS